MPVMRMNGTVVNICGLLCGVPDDGLTDMSPVVMHALVFCNCGPPYYDYVPKL
jgi:hypothetical protein